MPLHAHELTHVLPDLLLDPGNEPQRDERPQSSGSLVASPPAPTVSTWSPLLTGALRDEAAARVDAIAQALSGDANDWPLTRVDNPNGIRTVSLALGRCGFSLFHAWHHLALAAPGASDHAQRLLGEAAELLPTRTMDESLYCGFPGVAWTTEHVLRLLGASDGEDDPVEGIDEALLAVFEDEAFRPAYDLIGGLAGIGVHALERRERRTARCSPSASSRASSRWRGSSPWGSRGRAAP